MSKKIVAIGGGENGRIKCDGTKYPYELGDIDTEIISLTNKKNPNFLFLAHAQPIENQQSYFNVMIDIYEKLYGCQCKILLSNELIYKDKVIKLIDWADIIYEGGGNTKQMIELWKSTGFNIILRNAWENGKVMCGVSAGANCWFNSCSSDSLKIESSSNSNFISLNCLDFINAYFTPHCDAPGRYEFTKNELKENNLVGISLSNCSAIEIIDNKYRLITTDASYHGIISYGLKSYWNNGKFFEEYIDTSNKFKDLNSLITKKET